MKVPFLGSKREPRGPARPTLPSAAAALLNLSCRRSCQRQQQRGQLEGAAASARAARVDGSRPAAERARASSASRSGQPARHKDAVVGGRLAAEKPKGGLAQRPSVDAQLSAKLPGGGSAGKIDTSPPPTTTTTTEPGPAAATRFTNDLPANVTVAPTRLAGNYADLPMPPQKAMSVEDAAAAGGVVPLQDASNLLIASRQPSNATLQSKGSSRDSIFSQLMSSVSGLFGGGGGGGGSSSHVNRENSLDGLPRLASDPQMLLKSQLSSAEGIHLTEVEGAVAATGGAATADDDGYGGMLTGTDEDLTSIIDLAQLEEIVREADGEEQLDPSYGPNYTDTAVTDMASLLQSGGSSMDVLRVEPDLPSPSDLQRAAEKKGRGRRISRLRCPRRALLV